MMQSNCAVFRTGEVLQEGSKLIHEVYAGIDDVHVTDRSLIWNSDLIETLEFVNLIEQAVVTMDSAVNRTESPVSYTHLDVYKRQPTISSLKRSSRSTLTFGCAARNDDSASGKNSVSALVFDNTRI